MARGIENMVYDWVSGNLYWTDSFFRWVMTTDQDFRFYTPVFKTPGARPYGITIHVKLRYNPFYFFQYIYSLLLSKINKTQATKITRT